MEATMTAQASSTADGVMSTTGLVSMPVPAIVTTLTPPPPAPAKHIVLPSKKSRFLADFFSTRIYNCAACHGEALNILRDDPNISCHRKVETLEVKQLQNDILTWCSGWGGVTYWQLSLHKSYKNACEAEHSNKWEEELLEHATNRQGLLFELTSMVEQLADQLHMSLKLRELMRILMEMTQMVTMGITVLNMRCSILPNNLWGVEHLDLCLSSEEEGRSCSPREDIMDIEENSDLNLTVDRLDK
jgi:hypothetical protein